jgi:hypothetical protein
MHMLPLATRSVQLRRPAVATFPGVEAEKRGHFEAKESCPPDPAKSMTVANDTHHVSSLHICENAVEERKRGITTYITKAVSLEVELDQLVVRVRKNYFLRGTAEASVKPL